MRLDRTVYPGSRIERLRRPLRLPAVLLRALVYRHGRDTPRYEGDGIATNHFGPFEVDPDFDASYRFVGSFWEQVTLTDMRWRLWLLTRLARLCSDVPGDYAEFGTYRGGCAYMVLSAGAVPGEKRLLLFDTFEGIPEHRLTPQEADAGFAGAWSQGASAEGVAARLAAWSDQLEIRQGDVFDTVPGPDFGPFAFAHVDLNASAATGHVLEHVLAAMSPGGMIVFDDYGWDEYAEQRAVIDECFAGRPEDVVALPTGQAFVVAR